MAREIEVVVSRGEGAETEWLTPARTWSRSQDEALTLRFAPATNRDTVAITQLAHEYAGGLRRWLDLQTAIDSLFEERTAAYARAIWGAERPVPKTPEEAAEQVALMDAAFAADTSTNAAGLRTMQELSGRIWFMASWPSLVRRPPPGWESIADQPDDPPGIADVIRWAYTAALAKAAAGN